MKEKDNVGKAGATYMGPLFRTLFQPVISAPIDWCLTVDQHWLGIIIATHIIDQHKQIETLRNVIENAGCVILQQVSLGAESTIPLVSSSVYLELRGSSIHRKSCSLLSPRAAG